MEVSCEPQKIKAVSPTDSKSGHTSHEFKPGVWGLHRPQKTVGRSKAGVVGNTHITHEKDRHNSQKAVFWFGPLSFRGGSVSSCGSSFLLLGHRLGVDHDSGRPEPLAPGLRERRLLPGAVREGGELGALRSLAPRRPTRSGDFWGGEVREKKSGSKGKRKGRPP